MKSSVFINFHAPTKNLIGSEKLAKGSVSFNFGVRSVRWYQLKPRIILSCQKINPDCPITDLLLICGSYKLFEETNCPVPKYPVLEFDQGLIIL